MASIVDEIKQSYKSGSYLTRLIYINIAVFLVVLLSSILFNLFSSNGFSYLGSFVSKWFGTPTNLSSLIVKPWTLITYMFVQIDFWHLFFNLVWLYFGGRIFLEYFSQKKLLAIYLLGGLAGVALFVLSFNIFPALKNATTDLGVAIGSPRIIGSSASVLAILISIAAYVPNYTVRMFFLGNVKLKYIAIFAVFMDLLALSKPDFIYNNAGGHIAHLGGAMFGFIFARQMLKGKDLSKGFSKFLDSFFSWFKPKPKSPLRTVYKNTKSDKNYHERKASEQQNMDAILDKISKSGYDSLSKDEKDFLFRIGNK